MNYLFYFILLQIFTRKQNFFKRFAFLYKSNWDLRSTLLVNLTMMDWHCHEFSE